MEYRNLGNSGLKISELSFGSWVTFVNQLNEKKAMDCMSFAYERGINFFDNAKAYASGQSEVLMGNILKKLKWDRDTYIVSSKAFWGGELPTQKGLSKKHLNDACNAALKRLQVDYLDLFFCHRPDPETPILETVYAMNDLLQQGKIMYWGTSEWSAKELEETFKLCKDYNLRYPTNPKTLRGAGLGSFRVPGYSTAATGHPSHQSSISCCSNSHGHLRH